jgi:multidrug efflux pump subunit AcrA (membrane-fusion protein)
MQGILFIMKKVKKVIIVIAIITVIVAILVKIISSKVNGINNVENLYADTFFDTYTVTRDDVKSYVKGIGQVTSFNIETLEVESYEKISEILVSESQKVEKDQEIMKVTDGSTTRTIKAGISGLFFCVEENNVTKYCIYNLDDIGIKLSLGEKEVTTVSVGQKVSINITALNKDLEGTVEYVSSLPQNERYIVRVKIDYTDDVKFGYSATASILTKEDNDAIVIPYEYLNMDENEKYFVYSANYKTELYNNFWDNTDIPEEAKIYVEVGTITSNNVQIVSGLEAGEEIIKLSL